MNGQRPAPLPGWLSIKEFLPDRFLARVAMPVIALFFVVTVPLFVEGLRRLLWELHRRGCLWCGRADCGYRITRAAFNDLVEFAAVQPDAAALRAVVNFDP